MQFRSCSDAKLHHHLVQGLGGSEKEGGFFRLTGAALSNLASNRRNVSLIEFSEFFITSTSVRSCPMLAIWLLIKLKFSRNRASRSRSSRSLRLISLMLRSIFASIVA